MMANRTPIAPTIQVRAVGNSTEIEVASISPRLIVSKHRNNLNPSISHEPECIILNPPCEGGEEHEHDELPGRGVCGGTAPSGSDSRRTRPPRRTPTRSRSTLWRLRVAAVLRSARRRADDHLSLVAGIIWG